MFRNPMVMYTFTDGISDRENKEARKPCINGR
jgi:hypothetical protein